MMPQRVIDELYSEQLVAARIPALASERCAWIGIHPFKWDRILGDEYSDNIDSLPYRFRIRIIEVDKSFDFHSYDLHPEYIYYRHDSTADTIEEVHATLSALEINEDTLAVPWLCDYPL